jgi:sugar/nucleoside kinase (ribokinase family)
MYRRLIQSIDGAPVDSGTKKKALIGFDGFVDEIVHVVDKRLDFARFERIKTIEDYGKRIMKCKGLSSNIELVPIGEKLGGNGAIFANALKRFGLDITYVGSVGVNNIHPVFAELAEGSQIIGVAEPGRTDAVEFLDGKIISSKLKSLNELSWSVIKSRISPDRFADMIDRAALLSFNNWSMIPYMNEIWDGIIEEVFPLTKAGCSEKYLFIDMADPEKRSREDILRAIELLSKFRSKGINLILGLNAKESYEFLSLFGYETAELAEWPLEKLTRTLYDVLDLHTLIVHPVEKAGCISQGEYFETDGPFCNSPILTTGAGDNFNAGYMYGCIHGFAPDLCLMMGVASSGYYVRNAKSGILQEIVDFVQQWKTGDLCNRYPNTDR